ncbi:ABC transporter [Reticulibacter mediterranei]|uniref:ABC transporter n=1 Tax=Reticulibacter mediterranei TaxID=2778369 RepID=A0A8J3IE26_9CHLR|nr:ABC transporter permease subunit [Reticulibacter mediterranei]GHO91848.1 ABC transporter [Reticulibacter mediterranei]
MPGSVKSIEATPATSLAQTKRSRGRQWRFSFLNWLGLVPFLLFCLLFEILPALVIIQDSFADDRGEATIDNYQRMLSQASTLRAFQTSIFLSLVTAFLGALFGFLAAYGVYKLKTGWLRNFLIGFSSLAANFAGVPLAYAFISTLGVTGFVTILLHNWLHINLYDLGFSLYTFWGLVLVYTYFQLPLMVLVTIPALNALKPEWREAATNLGASTFLYWWRIALPVLLPSLIAGVMLLFANSFGAYASAYALAQGNINLVTILISFVVAGNVDMDTGLGNALSVGMMLVLLATVIVYFTMLRRVSLWQGR